MLRREPMSAATVEALKAQRARLHRRAQELADRGSLNQLVRSKATRRDLMRTPHGYAVAYNAH